MRNAAIVVLAATSVFLAYRLTEVEHQRYALVIGMCHGENGSSAPDLKCLLTVESRTSPLWHFYYALIG